MLIEHIYVFVLHN